MKKPGLIHFVKVISSDVRKKNAYDYQSSISLQWIKQTVVNSLPRLYYITTNQTCCYYFTVKALCMIDRAWSVCETMLDGDGFLDGGQVGKINNLAFVKGVKLKMFICWLERKPSSRPSLLLIASSLRFVREMKREISFGDVGCCKT